MPKDLYEEVKDEIPNHIGVYIVYQNNSYISLIKRPKKQSLDVDEQILKNSMIRSLYREFEKQYKSGNPTIIEGLYRRINRLEKEKNNYHNRYIELSNELFDIKHNNKNYINKED